MAAKPYVIYRNSPCPCRSGKKYKYCCEETINTKIKDKYYQFYQEGRFAEALIAYRAFLTQYIIWYNDHTVPFVNTKPLAADEILCLDIDALIEIIHGIVCCLNQLKNSDEIDGFLQRCVDIVKDERFAFCILGERAFWFFFQGNEQKARDILLSIKEIEPSKIITTFYGKRNLDLLIKLIWAFIPLGNCLKIFDALLSNSDDPLREAYTIAFKSLIYYVYLDSESAKKTIDEAITKFKASKPKDDFEISTLILEAFLYQLKGIVSNDNLATARTCGLFNQILSQTKDTELIAEIYYSLGQQYMLLNEYKLANVSFQKAYELCEIPHCGLVIDYAKSYFYLENLKRSQELLDSIDIKSINIQSIEYLYLIDYYSLLGEIAIKNDDRELAKRVQVELTNIEVSIPLFREMITKMRITLLDFSTHKNESKTVLHKFREIVSKYLILQPNFYGLGINLNELIKPQKPKK